MGVQALRLPGGVEPFLLGTGLKFELTVNPVNPFVVPFEALQIPQVQEAQAEAIVEIDYLTDGQASSAIFGGDVLGSPDELFLVYNIDTFVHPDALPAEAVRIDLPYATIALCWFSSYPLFPQVYNDYYSGPSRMEKGEHYIAPTAR